MVDDGDAVLAGLSAGRGFDAGAAPAFAELERSWPGSPGDREHAGTIKTIARRSERR
jgi:hypothetical protein